MVPLIKTNHPCPDAAPDHHTTTTMSDVLVRFYVYIENVQEEIRTVNVCYLSVVLANRDIHSSLS